MSCANPIQTPGGGSTTAGQGDGWTRRSLLSEAARPFFRAERVEIHGTAIRPWDENAWLVGVAVSGEGKVTAGAGDLRVSRGTTFAVPAAIVPDLRIESDGGLEFLACRPPDPRALAADAP